MVSVSSLFGRMYWFGAVKYNIGGFDFSANDIEHGVLRANAASPSSLGSLLGRPDWARGQFKAGDLRLALVRLPCWSLAASAGLYRRGPCDCIASWSVSWRPPHLDQLQPNSVYPAYRLISDRSYPSHTQLVLTAPWIASHTRLPSTIGHLQF